MEAKLSDVDTTPKERDQRRSMDEILEKRIIAMIEERVQKRLNSMLEQLQQYIDGRIRSVAQDSLSLTNERLELFVNQISQPIDDMAQKIGQLALELHSVDLECAGLAKTLQRRNIVTAQDLVEGFKEAQTSANDAVRVAQAAREAAAELEENFPESRIPQ